MSAAIELNHLTKQFGPKIAVNDVSFSIEEGHCYGLIGPNGAGKTTTFSMMCGYLYPSSGSISVMGQNPAVPGSLKRTVGVLPQDALLPAQWPVGEFLTYMGELSQLDNPREEAKRVLEVVQLPETWKLHANQLSHGMAKRVAMSQALLGSPPILLLDEPTAGLDPKVAAAVRGIIRSLKGAHTIVVSSHNLQELEELCDATAILDKGKLVRAATMSELTDQAAEFRVQLAKGELPLSELRAMPHVKHVAIDANKVLVVQFDGANVSADEIITATAVMIARHQVSFTTIWRGRRLEDKVLQLT